MLRIHQTPDLHFVLDDSASRAIAMSQLIDQALAGQGPSDDPVSS